jgi:hypothetical protein
VEVPLHLVGRPLDSATVAEIIYDHIDQSPLGYNDKGLSLTWEETQVTKEQAASGTAS